MPTFKDTEFTGVSFDEDMLGWARFARLLSFYNKGSIGGSLMLMIRGVPLRRKIHDIDIVISREMLNPTNLMLPEGGRNDGLISYNNDDDDDDEPADDVYRCVYKHTNIDFIFRSNADSVMCAAYKNKAKSLQCMFYQLGTIRELMHAKSRYLDNERLGNQNRHKHESDLRILRNPEVYSLDDNQEVNDFWYLNAKQRGKFTI